MVGLSDIPCVGKAVDRISEAIVDAGFRGLRYLLCYNSILNNLTSQIENVKVQEVEVSRKADADRADGKTIKDHVIKWQKGVEEIKTRADELFKQRPSWNPVTRFRLGRKAAQEAKNVADLTASGVELLTHEIAFLPAAENMPICDTTYQKFDSRKEAYKKLWEGLVKEDGHPVVGIYGMPGVGKTRMMEQAWEDAKDKKIFDKVTRANVGAEKIDLIKLQNQLAGFLDCHLKSEDNEVIRASQLKRSLINAGKTLVVLDDVWDQISLKNIGIPLGDDISKGCKILLTSRKEDVCLRNGCKDPIKIETLTDGEAWDMFENTVSTSKIESLKDKSLAKNVCKECAALPLLIHAVGNALKFETEDSWKHALFQLENCNFNEIDGIESKAYACIQLSFDKLKKDAKTCLLLCSLFAEDAEIQIKILVDFATGSQLLSHGGNVRGVLDNLKSSSLLLEGKTRRTVKMHDIIRDVARSVAARDQQYAFLFIRGDCRLPDVDDYSTRKLLQFVENDNSGYPTGLVCPDLHTLWLECDNKPQQFSNSFLEGIDNLKILVLKGMNVFPEQLSVKTFDKLTVLILNGFNLNETWLSFIPENLETLRISECQLPNPLGLSKLKSLRKLELASDSEIEMVQNSKSTLATTLVELHIPGGFRICDAEGKRSVPISSEINKLSVLRSLNIRLEDSESCPNENIVANLLDFVIDVGDKSYNYHDLDKMRSVIFNNRCIEGGGEVLVERAEGVRLEYVKGSQNGLNIEAYSNLEMLTIEHCEDMEHIVEWKAEYEIQQSQPLTYFSKLTELSIGSCRGLKYLFSPSVAECLVQLEKLLIWDCPTLEVVIRKERAIDGVIINFPKLKHLNPLNLQSLRSFYGESRVTKSNSTTIMDNAATSTAGSDSLFDDGMVAFIALETLFIRLLRTSKIWERNGYKNNSFCRLKLLSIWGCPNLEFAIPLAILPTIQNLKELDILDCKSMTGEVESCSTSSESSNPELLPLVALRSIHLDDMSALTQTRLNSSNTNLYPNLEILAIMECKSLRNVFLPSIAKDLLHLKELFVSTCDMMSEIIGEEEREGERINEFLIPELTILQLTELPNFKSFCFNESVEAGPATHQHQSYSTPKVFFPKLVELVLDVNTIELEEIQLGRNDSTSEITKLVVKCEKEVQLPSKWQLQLPNIEKLSLKNCWWHENSGEHNAGQSLINPYRTLSFQKLKEVEVDSCEVSPLFLCSVFRNLRQLQKLKVKDCPSLEEVVKEENSGVGTHEKTISLLQLEYIELNDLPKLKSFSRSKSYAFNMPALKSIVLNNCPQMEYFTCLEISTPLLPDFKNQNPVTTTTE